MIVVNRHDMLAMISREALKFGIIDILDAPWCRSSKRGIHTVQMLWNMFRWHGNIASSVTSRWIHHLCNYVILNVNKNMEKRFWFRCDTWPHDFDSAQYISHTHNTLG